MATTDVTAVCVAEIARNMLGYAAADASKLADEAMALWGDVLIDGHNRYDICTRHGIRYGVVHINGIASRDDAKIWIGKNQLGRRNLTDFQRVELALMMKPIVEARARAAHAANGGNKTDAASQISDAPIPEKIRTDDTVADLAGVSRDTVRKVEAIHESAPEIQQAARSGEISINLAAHASTDGVK